MQLSGPHSSVLTRVPRRLAFLTRADFAQKFPRVDPQVVIIIPRKLDRVLTHALGGDWFGGGLENQQGTGSGGGGIARTSAGLAALLFAHGARAGVPQVHESVVRTVAVIPFDVHARARR